MTMAAASTDDQRMQAAKRWREASLALATAAALAVTVSLGQWQLRRAAEKEALARSLDDRGRMAELQGHDLTRLSDPYDRRVRLTGRYLPRATIHLDNRQMEGRPGFFVLTPLRLSDHPSTVVLVQRGWIPRNAQDRLRLVKYPTPDTDVVVIGRVVPPPSRLFEFDAAQSGPVRQNVDLSSLAREFGLPLLTNLSVLQTQDDLQVRAPADGHVAGEGEARPPLAGGSSAVDDAPYVALRRNWPRIDSGVHKHYGYAVQWFGLAALLLVLYIWFRIVRPRWQRVRTNVLQ